ncbi:MAG: hypothetical protein IT180_00485 [Acidobacteria bacterium]|nr:hypothetical protein [Acidobacteriota bacterium]
MFRATGGSLCRLALGSLVPVVLRLAARLSWGRAMRKKGGAVFGEPPLVSGVAYFFFFAAFFLAAFFAFFAIVPPEAGRALPVGNLSLHQ